MLFPLPLTAFENYMLADDHSDQPMSFFLRLSFWGSLDRNAFQAAIQQTVARHPLFQALVGQVDGIPSWIQAENIAPQILWNDADEPSSEQAGYLDLAREVGVRVFVSHTEEQARVLFQFHHACTDGMGAVRFIEDLLAIYTAEHSGEGERPRLAPINRSLLRDRGTHGVSALGRFLRLPIDALATLGIAQFFFNRPTAIETPAKPRLTSKPGSQPAFVSRRISPEQLAGLRTAAKRDGVTVNDLLIRDLLLAIDAWNARHNPTACGSCLRVSVPVNLRRPSDAAMPATNVVSMVFVDRRVKASTNARRLLKSIRLDTWFIKQFRLALVFTWIIELMHGVRGGFKWLLGGESALATAVLSNLGVQFDDMPLAYLGDRVIVGDAMLDAIDFLPPIRTNTNASLGVVTYGGELMISLQYAPQVLTALTADDLLRLYDDQLATTAGIRVRATTSETVRVLKVHAA